MAAMLATSFAKICKYNDLPTNELVCHGEKIVFFNENQRSYSMCEYMFIVRNLKKKNLDESLTDTDLNLSDDTPI